MARKRKYFWHVPASCWFNQGPSGATGEANVGGDIVVSLLDAIGDTAARPQVDNWTIERIVGQYQFAGISGIGVNRFLHSRVYVAESDSGAISLRNLNLAEDAETSFLFHRVDLFHNSWDGDAAGNWQGTALGGSPAATAWKARHGDIDIRVGRRLEGGESLIWHTQMVPAPAADDELFLKLWLRMLVSEG